MRSVHTLFLRVRPAPDTGLVIGISYLIQRVMTGFEKRQKTNGIPQSQNRY